MKHFVPFLLLCIVGAGCASLGTPRPVRADAANPMTLEADFDDIDAAVAGVITRFRMIEIPKPSDDPRVRRFDLRGLDDSPGTLTFTQTPEGMIEIAATIGRFRQRDRERRLVAALATRLTQLRGEVAAPLSDR